MGDNLLFTIILGTEPECAVGRISCQLNDTPAAVGELYLRLKNLNDTKATFSCTL